MEAGCELALCVFVKPQKHQEDSWIYRGVRPHILARYLRRCPATAASRVVLIWSSTSLRGAARLSFVLSLTNGRVTDGGETPCAAPSQPSLMLTRRVRSSTYFRSQLNILRVEKTWARFVGT